MLILHSLAERRLAGIDLSRINAKQDESVTQGHPDWFSANWPGSCDPIGLDQFLH